MHLVSKLKLVMLVHGLKGRWLYQGLLVERRGSEQM